MEVKVRRCVSSTAQSEAREAVEEAVAGLRVAVELFATQNWAWLSTQNTSRQQAVTPRFGGSLENWEERLWVWEDAVGVFWDCNRTRTTSRGVTVTEVSYKSGSEGRREDVPSSEVRTLPQVAEIIRW